MCFIIIFKERRGIFAFVCNAKSFIIACVVVFFPSPSRRCFSNGLAKVFLQMFHHSLHRKRVTRIGIFSMDTLGNVFVRVLFIFKIFVCVLKRGHVESCPSTTKNISSLPQCQWPPNVAGWWLAMRGPPPSPHRTIWPFDHVVMRDHVTNYGH